MSFSLIGPTTRIAKIALPLLTPAILVAACSSSTGGSGGGSSTPAGTAAGSSTGGSAATSSIIITDGHLTNSAGRTIYLWVADTAGKSTCSGACAAVWPPVPGNDRAGAGVSAAKLTTIKGAGGGTQLAYAGHPLYYFASDTSAGQVTGQGSDSFGAKWWEVDAAGKAVTTSGAASGGASAAPAASSSAGSNGGGSGY